MNSKMDIAAKTDTGKVRDNNEDAISYKLLSSSKLFAMVADGMGGHRSGDVASQLAIKSLHIQLQKITWDEENFLNLIKEINEEIFTQSEQHPHLQGMGTTLVVCCIDGETLWLCHVGDSRCYRFNEGKLEQLTRDHSLVEEMLDQGLIEPEEVASSKHKNLLTRALGVHETVQPTISKVENQSPGLLLLCSDGLTDMLDENTMIKILEAEKSLENKTSDLIDAANEAGGKDNVSVVLVQY